MILQSKADVYTEIEFLNQENLHDQYPRIYDFANFSLAKARNLDHIKELLYGLIRAMPLIDQPMLGSWGAIKVRIENSVNKFRNNLSIKAFQVYCNNIIRDLPEMFDAGEAKLARILFSEADTRNFAQYLSKIGLLLYFPENAVLKDKVFPNQNHLLGQIHTALKAFAKGNGITHKADINDVFKSALKPKELNTLVEIMIHFKIAFQHPADNTALIAPLYLPKKPVKAIQIFLPQFKKPAFRYVFKAFIHRNVVLEFFVTFGRQTLHEGSHSNTYYFWRDGLVLKDEVTHEVVLVQFNNNAGENLKKEARIDVFSLDGGRGVFLKQIVKELDRITHDRKVEKCVSLNGHQFIPLKDIRIAENKEHYVFNYKCNYYKLVDFKEYLNKTTHMKNIFISYSKDDLPMVNTFIKHLAGLQRDGIVGHWYCTELVAGQ